MQTSQIHSDRLTATFLARGASLVGLSFKGDDRNLVLGFVAPANHTHVPAFAGALVGPIANRISKGQVLLADKICRMTRNEAGNTTLHSGPTGLHTCDWQVRAHGPDHIIFMHTISDGFDGLPGNRTIIAHYKLNNDTLSLTITAKSDATTAMNIAAHPYWNLDGQDTVADHTLHIASDKYLPTDDRNLPTGEIRDASGTQFDFTRPMPVPCDPTLDVNYCLSDRRHATPHHAATLTGADQTTLHIATTEPGLQVYNGAYLPMMPSALTTNRDLHPYGAIALEPQGWPDAPNNPSFPQITLLAGDTYTQLTTYTLIPPP